jgi:hypothetical protein
MLHPAQVRFAKELLTPFRSSFSITCLFIARAVLKSLGVALVLPQKFLNMAQYRFITVMMMGNEFVFFAKTAKRRESPGFASSF